MLELSAQRCWPPLRDAEHLQQPGATCEEGPKLIKSISTAQEFPIPGLLAVEYESLRKSKEQQVAGVGSSIGDGGPSGVNQPAAGAKRPAASKKPAASKRMAPSKRPAGNAKRSPQPPKLPAFRRRAPRRVHASDQAGRPLGSCIFDGSSADWGACGSRPGYLRRPAANDDPAADAAAQPGPKRRSDKFFEGQARCHRQPSRISCVSLPHHRHIGLFTPRALCTQVYGVVCSRSTPNQLCREQWRFSDAPGNSGGGLGRQMGLGVSTHRRLPEATGDVGEAEPVLEPADHEPDAAAAGAAAAAAWQPEASRPDADTSSQPPPLAGRTCVEWAGRWL